MRAPIIPPKFLIGVCTGVFVASVGFYAFDYSQRGAESKKNQAVAAGGATERAHFASTKPREGPTVFPASVTAQVGQISPALAAVRMSPPPGVLKVLPDLTVAIQDWRLFQPHEITVMPRPNMPVSFVAVSIDQEADRTTWIGRSEIDNAIMVAIGTKDIWTAVLALPYDYEFTVTVAGGNSVVVDSNPDLDTCGNNFEADQPRLPANASARADLAGVPSPDGLGNYTVDVVLLYDGATEKAAVETVAASGLGITAEAYIDSTMRTRIEAGNLALEQSGVNNLRWRCVGLFKIPAYENAGNKMAADLDLITYATGSAGQYARDKAVETGADQTVLVVGGNREYTGLAWAPGHHAVVQWAASYITFTHELAHNFSCQHDRQTNAAKDGDGQFFYGYRYTNKQGRDTGTIMSYAGYRLPYFSNPDLFADGVALGISEAQPKAADNARTLREHAATMAGFREQITILGITQQPQSVTVNPGDTITFTVAAIGENLSYQWALSGTAIAGAVAAAFSRNSVTTKDAGSYTVTVSDPKSSMQSNPATATVNPVSAGNPSSSPSSSSSSATSGSGGGGGGAPSLWFYGALALLVAIRRLPGLRRK